MQTPSRAVFPTVDSEVIAGLIRQFWAIPGSAGGIVAMVATVLALMALTMVAAIRKDTLSGAD